MGQRVGPYRLLHWLGQGGMAEVWRAKTLGAEGFTKDLVIKRLLPQLGQALTREFGKGFDASNLRYMRLFYQAFPKCDALRHELSWTHYRLLLRVEDCHAREWYAQEAAGQNWSTRQLERQIGTLYYERLLASRERAGAYLARMLFLGGAVGFWFFSTQLLQGVLHLRPLLAGLAFLPVTLPNFASAIAVPRLARRYGKIGRAHV